MSNIDKINNIPFQDVLLKLGFIEWHHYITKGDVIYMKDWWRLTDWWRGSIKWWFLKCHSWLKPWRFEWDRLKIIKDLYNLDDAWAFSWYETNFNLPTTNNRKSNTNPIKEKWENEWKELSPPSIEFLSKRAIDYDKVKNEVKEFNSWIWWRIQSLGLEIQALQTRNLNPLAEKSSRYRIEAWPNWAKWLFISDYDKDDKVFYIVEWFTDYLTLKQFKKNVAWLVSATAWIEYVKELSNRFEIIFIPDADEAWDKAIELFKENKIRFWLYDISEFGKDVNDAWVLLKEQWVTPEIFISSIYEDAEKPKKNLELAFDKAKKILNAWSIKIWNAVFDKMTWGLWRWKTMLINWPSGQWKTTLSLHIITQIITNNPEIKVNYYSLETDIWTQLCQILWFIYNKPFEYILNNIDNYRKDLPKLAKLDIFDDIRTFEDIKSHITLTWPDVAIIDFAQKVRIDWKDEKEKMINYAQWMQDFAIDNGNVSIISLSQTAMNNYTTPILQRTPKDSWALFESSDTTINVWRDENWQWVVAFLKTKNIWAKGWYTVCPTKYDFNTWEYLIFEPFKDEDIPAPKKKKYSI